MLNTQSFSGKVGVIVFFIRIVRIVRKNFRLFRKFMIRIKRIRMYYCLVSAVRNRALKYKPIGKNIRLPCLFPLRMMMLSFSLFASHTIPRILITDKEGIIRAVYTDDPLATYQELAKDIDAVLIDKLSGNER